MTENEAIEIIKTEKACVLRNIQGCDRDCGKCDLVMEDSKILEGYDMAISALEEIQKYRSIGTVEECREAMEKQKAKQPDIWGDGYSEGKLVYDMYDCPNCGKSYEIDHDDYDYCPNCGQKLYRRRQGMECIDCKNRDWCKERQDDRMICGCATGKPSNKLTEQEAIAKGMDAIEIFLGILDGMIIPDLNKPSPNEMLHGKVVGTRMDPYHNVTIYEDGYEDRYYLGD